VGLIEFDERWKTVYSVLGFQVRFSGHPNFRFFDFGRLPSPNQGPLKFENCQIYQIQLLYFILNPPFILVASTTAKLCRVLVEKMAKKCQFFTFFGVTRQNFLGSHWNISTNEPVLERLLNFWIFGTYFKLIAHLVWANKPSKVKKSKIRVTRKPDLEIQNWVYSFSSFIELYQTYIVTVQMLSTFFHLLDRVMYEIEASF
jgi:hypothetical protein